MRTIGRNKLVITDNINDGEELVIFYKRPTTSAIIRFYSEYEELSNGKDVTPEIAELTSDFGYRHLVGYEYGCFGISDDAGNDNPVGCYREHDNYREDWKELLFGEGRNDDILHTLGNFLCRTQSEIAEGNKNKKKLKKEKNGGSKGTLKHSG